MRWWLVGRVKLLGRKAEECLPLFWVFAERVSSNSRNNSACGRLACLDAGVARKWAVGSCSVEVWRRS